MKNIKILMVLVGSFAYLNASNPLDKMPIREAVTIMDDSIKKIEKNTGLYAEIPAAFGSIYFPVLTTVISLCSKSSLSCLSWNELYTINNCYSKIAWFGIKHSRAKSHAEREELIRGFEAEYNKCIVETQYINSKTNQFIRDFNNK